MLTTYVSLFFACGELFRNSNKRTNATTEMFFSYSDIFTDLHPHLKKQIAKNQRCFFHFRIFEKTKNGKKKFFTNFYLEKSKKKKKKVFRSKILKISARPKVQNSKAGRNLPVNGKKNNTAKNAKNYRNFCKKMKFKMRLVAGTGIRPGKIRPEGPFNPQESSWKNFMISSQNS